MMSLRTGILCMIALGTLAGGAAIASAQVASAERLNLGLRGVYFVENQGQWRDPSVEYGFKTRGLDIAFRESSFTMHLAREVERASRLYERFDAPQASPKRERGFFTPDDPDPLPHGRGSSSEAVDCEHLTLTVTFPGSNPATPRGAQPQAAKFNYYIGDDESRWASDVPSYAAIIYENLYDGVDLHICGNDDGVLKYEFYVAPGADWNQIRIAYDGIDSLCVNETGDLEIATAFGTLTDSVPLVWQEDADFTPSPGSAGEGRGGGDLTSRSTIPARFELVDETTYRFALDGPVDPTRQLVLDPEISWMYYYGGTHGDTPNDAIVDSMGNIVVTGYTKSNDFVGRRNNLQGIADAFVFKTNPAGSLLWMSYYGGSVGEDPLAIAETRAGGYNIAGSTSSPDFPARLNSIYGNGDAFLLSLDLDGAPNWMVYLGGSANDYGYGLALDAQGNSWIVGETYSFDFVGRTNSRMAETDAFALRVDRHGVLQWMLYLGGSSNPEAAYDVALDLTGNAYVCGATASHDFRGAINQPANGRNAFALRLSPIGQLDWMVYFGGAGDDSGWAVHLAGPNELYIGGNSNSPTLPEQLNEHRGGRDGFVARLDSSGSVEWSMYVGGSNDEQLLAITTDEKENLVVCGDTTSDDIDPKNRQFYGGERDAYIARVSPVVGVVPVYLGGSDIDFATQVIRQQRDTYLVVGSTRSRDFIGRRNAAYREFDAYLLRYEWESPSLQLMVAANCPSGGPIGVSWSNATPDRTAVLLFARNTGSFTVPINLPCAGAILGLGTQQLQIAFTGPSGPDGSRTLNANAGPNACGGYLQLLDLTTCSTSNVVRIE